jgi:3-phenylpropionate/cinnamic acid dioxygenase small subunit
MKIKDQTSLIINEDKDQLEEQEVQTGETTATTTA